MKASSKWPARAGLMLAMLPAFSLADITYVQTVSVTAGGSMSGFSSETRVQTQISGDRSRTEVTPAGEMAADLAVANTRLVRLDKDAMYQLLPDSQSYREVTLTELRREISGLREQVDSAAGGQALPIRVGNCEWSEAKFRTKKTRESGRIAGIRATRHIMSMKQSCTDQSSGLSCEMEWTMEPWMATRVPDHEEVRDFYQNLADKLSMDYLIPQMPGASQMLLAMFPDRWESLLDEMEGFKGYPVRNVMTLKLGGDLCTTEEGVPIAEDGVWADAGTAAYNKAIQQTGSETGRAVGNATGEAMGDSVGGSVGSSAIGAATGELVGGLAGMFKKEKPKRTSTRKTAAPKDVTVFRIQSEITEWNRDPVPAERYDVPSGWTRLD